MTSLKALRGRPIAAADGDFGSIVDVYFDDQRWCVRYFVVDTGNPMPQRKVLVSPQNLGLARKELARCPELEEDKPVYLQHDMSATVRRGDPHLRSSEVVSGCGVVATDGLAGHLKDLLADPHDWSIKALAIDTGLWFPGKRVLLAPQKVEAIDWLERKVRVRLSRRALALEQGRAEDRAVERVG